MAVAPGGGGITNGTGGCVFGQRRQGKRQQQRNEEEKPEIGKDGVLWHFDL